MTDQHQHQQGQGLVEFALILPILLLAMLLFLAFAQLFNTWSGLQSAAVAGARHVSDTGDQADVQTVIQETLTAHLVDPSDVSISITILNPDGSPKGCTPPPCLVEFGDLVRVELGKPFDIRVLGWQAQGQIPATHQVRAQHGAWTP